MGHLRALPVTNNRAQFANQIEFRHGGKITSHHDSDSSPRSHSEPLDTVGRFLRQESDFLINGERGKMTFRERSSVGSSGPNRSAPDGNALV